MSNVVSLRSGPTSSQNGPLTYSVAQVSKLLGLGLGLTYTLVRSGEIPAKQLGSRWVIPCAVFHAWLDDTGHAEKEAS